MVALSGEEKGLRALDWLSQHMIEQQFTGRLSLKQVSAIGGLLPENAGYNSPLHNLFNTASGRIRLAGNRKKVSYKTLFSKARMEGKSNKKDIAHEFTGKHWHCVIIIIL